VLPRVTIVFLVYNRREELRASLRHMLEGSDYPRDRVDVIVVDNASKDGSAEMVRAEFPGVRLIARDSNCGVSGWNDGFAVARGDYVLALDDDCYLPAGGLRRAVEAAQEHDAQLASFAVVSEEDPDFRFDTKYQTGLLTFWGCAVLVRRDALGQLGGYDPEITYQANELEFMVRFFDRGFRHLYLPEVTAVHMKPPLETPEEYVSSRRYEVNCRHFAYIAAKLLRPRDALGTLVALLTFNVRDAIRLHRRALRGAPFVLAGFATGLRHRAPVRPAVSRFYRRNFHSFANPLALSRPPHELALALPLELVRARLGLEGRPPGPGRGRLYVDERADLYPATAATLQL
jgi:GT2 family glycosyltransferase